MKNCILIIIVNLLFFSCKNNNDKQKDDYFPLSELSSPATDSCAEPYLFTDKNGIVYLSWIEKNGKESNLKFSTLSNENWSEPLTITSGNNWFVNWADYPIISADGNNNMLAHFLEKSASSTYAYDVKYTTSSDKGKSWSLPKILHDDGKQAEHGFVSMIPYGDKYFISWLDGRSTATGENAGHKDHQGQMTIRGALLSKEGIKEKEWELDNRVCDCCQTTAAITDNGPVVIYRDRSEQEIRDMSIVRFVNGQWTKPKIIFPDNWKITGCPVNGPRADAIGNSLAIAWFSMAEKKGQVKTIFSEDGGETFKTPIQIDEGNAIGRVDVVMLDEKTAMVSWMEGSAIKAVKVNANGTVEPSITVATSSESRSSGFPQMSKSGNKIYFAWTDNKEKVIRVAHLFIKKD